MAASSTSHALPQRRALRVDEARLRAPGIAMALGMVAMVTISTRHGWQAWTVTYALMAFVIAGGAIVQIRRRHVTAALHRCSSAACGACMAYMFAIDAAGVPAISWTLAGCCGAWSIARLLRAVRLASLRRAAPQLVMGVGMACMLGSMASVHGSFGAGPHHAHAAHAPMSSSSMPADMPGMSR